MQAYMLMMGVSSFMYWLSHFIIAYVKLMPFAIAIPLFLHVLKVNSAFSGAWCAPQ